jgi:uncharacterized membrane protein
MAATFRTLPNLRSRKRSMVEPAHGERRALKEMVMSESLNGSEMQKSLAAAQAEVTRKTDLDEAIEAALVIARLSQGVSMYGAEADRKAIHHHSYGLMQALYRLKQPPPHEA